MRPQNAQTNPPTHHVCFTPGNEFSGLRISRMREAGPQGTRAMSIGRCCVQPAGRAGPPQEVLRGTQLGTRGCPRRSHPEKNSVSHEISGIVLAPDRSFAVAAPQGGRIEEGRFQDPPFPTVPVARPTVRCCLQPAGRTGPPSTSCAGPGWGTGGVRGGPVRAKNLFYMGPME